MKRLGLFFALLSVGFAAVDSALLKKANAGETDAMVAVAKRLRDTRPGESIQWYAKAADKGAVEAQARYGMALAIGRFIPRDFKRALVYLERAGQGNDRSAQAYLVRLYWRGYDAYGNEVPMDQKKAIAWQEHEASAPNGLVTDWLEVAKLLLQQTQTAVTEADRERAQKLVKQAKEKNATLDAELIALLGGSEPAALTPPPIPSAPTAVPMPDPRTISIEQLAPRYTTFEKDFDAATSATDRTKAAAVFGRWIDQDLTGPMTKAEAGEWVLRRFTSRLERYPVEAWNILLEMPESVVSNETIKRVLPAALVATMQAEAQRFSDEFKAEQQKKGEIARLLPLANAGDAKAQFDLGMAYLSLPDGSKRFWAHAVHWLTKAHYAGVAGAAAPLNKVGAEVNERLRTAVANNDDATLLAISLQKANSPLPDASVAALSAGRTLMNPPPGITRDLREAVRLLTQAAEAGNSEAAVALGLFYVATEDQPINEAEALRWFRRAAGSRVAPDGDKWIALLEPPMDRSERARQSFEIGRQEMSTTPGVVKLYAAKPWMRYAARLGHPEAIKLLALTAGIGK